MNWSQSSALRSQHEAARRVAPHDREDRELLAELARLNRAMVPFAMRIMEGTANADEQHDYALRLIAAGEWLQRRADAMHGAVVDSEVLITGPLTLPAGTGKYDS